MTTPAPATEPTPPAYGDPICCPFCRETNPLFVNGFRNLTCAEIAPAHWDMDEYQCHSDTCQGRSFFV